MKNVTTIAVLCTFFISVNLSAQESDAADKNPTDQGTIFVGATTNGGLNFSKNSFEFDGNTSNESKTNSFSIGSSVGYFFADNIVAGIQLNFATSTIEFDDTFDTESSSTSISAGPFVRYYFEFGSPTVRPYATVSAAIGSSKTKDESVALPSVDSDIIFGESEFRQSLFSWGAGAGVAFFLNDTIAIDVEVGYLNRTRKDKDSDFDSKFKTSNIGLNAGFSIFL